MGLNFTDTSFYASNEELGVTLSALCHTESSAAEVVFTVDGSINKTADQHPKRLSMTRWLIKAFNAVKRWATKHNYILFCVPNACDGELAYRYRAYKKMGFVAFGEFMFLGSSCDFSLSEATVLGVPVPSYLEGFLFYCYGKDIADEDAMNLAFNYPDLLGCGEWTNGDEGGKFAVLKNGEIDFDAYAEEVYSAYSKAAKIDLGIDI